MSLLEDQGWSVQKRGRSGLGEGPGTLAEDVRMVFVCLWVKG